MDLRFLICDLRSRLTSVRESGGFRGIAPDYAAPERLLLVLGREFYKYASPTGFKADAKAYWIARSTMERVMGIEPTWPAWKAGTLPLSYTRGRYTTTTTSWL